MTIFIGKKYELPIKDGAINATDLSKIKDEHGEVTRSFDPAYMNTVNCVRPSYLLLIQAYRYLRFHLLMEIKAFLNTEVTPLNNLLNTQPSSKSPSFSFSVNSPTKSNSVPSPRKS